MADKKLSNGEIILWAVFILWVVSVFGCASQSSREDSAHYVAQAQPQGYPCPSCGFLIPDKDVSPKIGVENKCSNCQKIFFGVPVVKSRKKNYQSGYYGLYGPRIYGPTSFFRSNTEVEVFVVSGGGFNETETGFVFWNIWFRDIDIDRDYIRSSWTMTRY